MPPPPRGPGPPQFRGQSPPELRGPAPLIYPGDYQYWGDDPSDYAYVDELVGNGSQTRVPFHLPSIHDKQGVRR